MRNSKPILLLLLISTAMATNAWAEETPGAVNADEAPEQSSNMQSWEDEDRKDNWTWFGMGYESRRSFSDMNGTPGTGASGGAGPGGPGGHGSPGGRR